MHHNLEEQLNAVDDEIANAVMNDVTDEILLSLQEKRIQIEKLILGNDLIA